MNLGLISMYIVNSMLIFRITSLFFIIPLLLLGTFIVLFVNFYSFAFSQSNISANNFTKMKKVKSGKNRKKSRRP